MYACCFFRLSATSTGLERDGGVEEAEEDDQRDVEDVEQPVAALEDVAEAAAMPGIVQVRQRGREHQQRGGEDRRDRARRVHLERQVRGLPAVDPSADVRARSRSGCWRWPRSKKTIVAIVAG